MKKYTKIKLAIVMLWLLPCLLLHSLANPHESFGKETGFSLGSFEDKVTSYDMLNALLQVRDFFEALCEGKVDILKELMDENLREEYHLSLIDPSYPDLLRKFYEGSKITIENVFRNETGSYVIDAKLVTPNSGANQVRFEIEPDIEKKRGIQTHRLQSFTVKSQLDSSSSNIEKNEKAN